MIKLEIHVNKMGDCHSVELKKEVKMRNCMIHYAKFLKMKTVLHIA